MAKDIAGGYLLVTEKTLFRLDRAQIEKVVFEIQRKLREVRGSQPDLENIDALRERNVVMQRLNSALRVAEAVRRKRRF